MNKRGMAMMKKWWSPLNDSFFTLYSSNYWENRPFWFSADSTIFRYASPDREHSESAGGREVPSKIRTWSFSTDYNQHVEWKKTLSPVLGGNMNWKAFHDCTPVRP